MILMFAPMTGDHGNESGGEKDNAMGDKKAATTDLLGVSEPLNEPPSPTFSR